MKLATFEIPTAAGPLRRIGAAVDGRLIDFAAAYAAHLDKADPGCDAQRLAGMLFPSDMVAFLGAGDIGRRAADQAIEAASNTRGSVRRAHELCDERRASASRRCRGRA